ncbi:Peroxisome biogenesis protein 7 [Camellia lanceoleosa]|uniref:Peroxisome biogenesis protein 7 n=1 Tax=Camellia lanceoleosa TaxID=1840588 RepID=A0ACC0FNK6_9ERIC|nr:Peroxisome biogenesis protein 7 [Camellia lanceoleosa]
MASNKVVVVVVLLFAIIFMSASIEIVQAHGGVKACMRQCIPRLLSRRIAKSRQNAEDTHAHSQHKLKTCVYDLAWSESHDFLLVAAVADGSVKLYNLSLPPTANPVRSLHEHTCETHSVDYNPVCRDSFITSSWDDTIKLWTIDRPTSVRTFKREVVCHLQCLLVNCVDFGMVNLCLATGIVVMCDGVFGS